MRGIQLSVMVRIVSVAALIHLAGAADVARAASATWDGPGGTGGDSNWNDSANWSGGVVPDNGAFTYDVFVDGGKLANSVVRINAFTPTVDNLTINVGDRVDINNGNSLTVVDTGTILNDGVIDLHSTGTGTALLINGSVAMTGSGVVEIGNGTHFNNLNVIEGRIVQLTV